MSRLRNERLKVGLGTRRVAAVRLTGIWRPRLAAMHVVDYAPTSGESQSDAAVRALRGALAVLGGSGGRCSVVLGNTFVRYAVLPWHDAIVSHHARKAYASAQLANLYGAALQDWETLTEAAGFGQPTTVCALDRGLHASLRMAAQDAGHKLVSVRPYLSVALKHCRPQLREHDLWFAVTEADRICLAHLVNGIPVALRSQRARSAPAAELAAMVERETLACAGEAGSLYIFAPEMAADALMSAAPSKSHRIDPQPLLAPVGGDVRYAMALA